MIELIWVVGWALSILGMMVFMERDSYQMGLGFFLGFFFGWLWPIIVPVALVGYGLLVLWIKFTTK